MTSQAFTLSDGERGRLDVNHVVDDDLEIVALPVHRGSASRVQELARLVQSRAEGADAVADLLTRVRHVPPPETAAALARIEERWRDLEARHGLLSGAEVADLAGSRARNRSEHASALARQGKVLAVRRGGRARYPGFQFTEHGAPRTEVADVLAVLRDAEWSDESIALWFDAANGYLDDRRPAAVLADQPDAVVSAATYAAAKSDW